MMMLTNKTLFSLCLSAMFVASATANGTANGGGAAAAAAMDGHADAPSRCDLVCANGGYCTLREGDPEQLAKSAQAGQLIEVCVCQPGYTGIACENVVEQCSTEARVCHNGLPCDLDPLDGEWKCNCSKADSLSKFAGKMCRKPVTEYCSGRFRPDSDLSFCTNGGRCKADFIAAQIAPGDTSVNRAYQHAGCACPPEFYGPHCEFLKLNDMDEDHAEQFESTSTEHDILLEPNQNEEESKTVYPFASFLVGITLVLIGFLAFTIVRQRYRNQTSEEPVEGRYSDDAGLDQPNHGQWSGSNLYPNNTDEEMDSGIPYVVNSYSTSGPVLRDFEPATSY